MKPKTEKLILSLGAMPNLRGFRYLGDAIDIYAGHKGPVSITKELYPAVAELHNTTDRRVERCIRHVIQNIGDAVPMHEVVDILGTPPRALSLSGTYTNAEFIALCALRIGGPD